MRPLNHMLLSEFNDQVIKYCERNKIEFEITSSIDDISIYLKTGVPGNYTKVENYLLVVHSETYGKQVNYYIDVDEVPEVFQNDFWFNLPQVLSSDSWTDSWD